MIYGKVGAADASEDKWTYNRNGSCLTIYTNVTRYNIITQMIQTDLFLKLK